MRVYDVGHRRWKWAVVVAPGEYVFVDERGVCAGMGEDTGADLQPCMGSQEKGGLFLGYNTIRRTPAPLLADDHRDVQALSGVDFSRWEQV